MEGFGLIDVAKGRNKWQVVANMVKKLWAP